MQQELDVLVEQLDELLGSPIVDPDDALEVAIVAGLAHRLGAPPATLADAIAWRDGDGADLLEETWLQVDLEPLLEEVEACTGGGRTDEQVEEALFEVDDVIAAALWCGRRDVARDACRQLASTVREVPDVFASLSDLGSQLARLPAVADDLGLYDYWFAVADAARVSGGS